MAKRRKYNSKKSKDRKPFFIFRVIYRLIIIVSVASLFLSYIAVFINPAIFRIPMLFGLFFIPIVLINIALFVCSILNKSKTAWSLLLFLLPSLFFVEYFYKVNNKNEHLTFEGEKIELLTYNVGRFQANRDGSSSIVSLNKIRNYIKNSHADIVCLQEYQTSDSAKNIMRFKEYPYQYHHFIKWNSSTYVGNITYSKYPIKRGESISFPKSTNLSIYTDLMISGKIIRLYNSHLESYNLSFSSIIKKMSGNYDSISHELDNVHNRMLGRSIKRASQTNLVLGIIHTCPYQAIICGDFNDTPMSYTYHKLSTGRIDTFMEAGKGFSSTYYRFYPLLRIDYVLIPSDFKVKNHETDKINYSDHYPVHTTFYIK